MPLSEEAFIELVDRGCPDCTSKKLLVQALVTQKVPLLGGEVYGEPSWSYKGEELVIGTYRVQCEGCKRELFTATACPRCASAGGVERALASANELPLPERCAPCGSQKMAALAYVPARVSYEGKRAGKARSLTTPDDPGFHAFRVECTSCHDFTVRGQPCPLCGAVAGMPH